MHVLLPHNHAKKEGAKRFTLFNNHNGSLLRRQPRAHNCATPKTSEKPLEHAKFAKCQQFWAKQSSLFNGLPDFEALLGVIHSSTAGVVQQLEPPKMQNVNISGKKPSLLNVLPDVDALLGAIDSSTTGVVQQLDPLKMQNVTVLEEQNSLFDVLPDVEALLGVIHSSTASVVQQLDPLC